MGRGMSKPRIRKPRAAEQPFQAKVLLALSKMPGLKVWRQNVGTVQTAAGHYFHAGPPRGAADIGGIVGPEGWALQIECKGEDTEKHESEETLRAQERWATMIRALGGIYLKVHAEEGVEKAIRRVESAIADKSERPSS